MAVTYNKVILCGRVTRDPTVSATPSGAYVMDFSLAVNRRWKGAGGQEREETIYADIKLWGKLVDALQGYITKGTPLLVDGRLSSQTWEAKEGGKRTKWFVTGETVQVLFHMDGDVPPDQGAAAGQGGQVPREKAAPGPGAGKAGPSAKEDDTIPF